MELHQCRPSGDLTSSDADVAAVLDRSGHSGLLPAQHGGGLSENFVRRVTVTSDGCWAWTGPTTSEGYGKFSRRVEGRVHTSYAHRFSYEQLVGLIPDGMQIDHLCRVRNCVNPGHLECVTPKVNAERSEPATRTSCVKGHPYTETNTGRDQNGWRFCRTCAADATRAWRAKEPRPAALPFEFAAVLYGHAVTTTTGAEDARADYRVWDVVDARPAR